MSNTDFLYAMLNNIYLGMSQVTSQVPMGGDYWIELSTEMMVERMFRKFRHLFTPASKRPADICRAWIDVMDAQGFVNKHHYRFQEEGDRLRVEIQRQGCIYLEYCTTAREEGLPFVCPRMVSCKWVVSHVTDQPYQVEMTINSEGNSSIGYISPAGLADNILARKGDRITIAGERAVVVSTNTYGYLLKAIYQYAPQILPQVLYQSSYSASLVEYDRVDPRYPDKRELIEWLLQHTNYLGVIRYEIVEFDEINKRARIRGYGSYMAEMFLKHNLFLTPHMTCDSARGRLAAYFSRAWNMEMECEEMECEALGNSCCEFVVLPKHL